MELSVAHFTRGELFSMKGSITLDLMREVPFKDSDALSLNQVIGVLLCSFDDIHCGFSHYNNR